MEELLGHVMVQSKDDKGWQIHPKLYLHGRASLASCAAVRRESIEYSTPCPVKRLYGILGITQMFPIAMDNVSELNLD